ncbi:stAR-related lipid transfer protein 6 [Spea bombifrons]|uniref:stAR-related lipid transfer protein 6 n=1 Tax=Spea bombifrons TaxID=233779 RepID=UPI00234AD20A|nr:stAR-related lipid transfer protein 6 [Spea bombifrons]XP_053304188.1 stAR-related lipid transfer protein 6 [Spea bombifrons]XP_053304190.1 stAR-related lipid transfer protein 6 [Spea bombifrons]
MDYPKIAADVSRKILSYSEDTVGWKTGKTSKNVVVSWKPSNEYSGNIYRGEGIVEGTPEKIIPFLYLPEYRTKWDKALQSYSLLEQIDKDTVISQSLTHSYGMGLISPREFIDVTHIKKYDGGVITTNSISVEYPTCPVSPSYVRGFNNPCGYVCSPLPENPAQTRFVVFIQPELGGLLPRSVVESALPNNVINLINDVRVGLKKLLS